MNIIKKENYYLAQSSKDKKKYYQVNLDKNECNCPHFLIRLKKKGELCKHIIEVKKILFNDAKDDFQKAISYVEKNIEVDSICFIEKFSLGLLDELIKRGELIENKGKVSLLK
jgi:predicted nucleic acid-binding Zn finger protein